MKRSKRIHTDDISHKVVRPAKDLHECCAGWHTFSVASIHIMFPCNPERTEGK